MPVSAPISMSRKVVLEHLSVTISMNAFLLVGTLPAHRNATWWATFPCVCYPYWCNTHVHDLEVVKIVKMPRDDRVNSTIPLTCFCMHGSTFFLLQKSTLKTHQRKHTHGKLALFSVLHAVNSLEVIMPNCITGTHSDTGIYCLCDGALNSGDGPRSLSSVQKCSALLQKVCKSLLQWHPL